MTEYVIGQKFCKKKKKKAFQYSILKQIKKYNKI